tara:strand:+ start:1052 stop:1156 length:105 start_codon:yes stop_codon:yes gene_type:complete
MGTQGFEPRPPGLEPDTLPDYAMPPLISGLVFGL